MHNVSSENVAYSDNLSKCSDFLFEGKKLVHYESNLVLPDKKKLVLSMVPVNILAVDQDPKDVCYVLITDRSMTYNSISDKDDYSEPAESIIRRFTAYHSELGYDDTFNFIYRMVRISTPKALFCEPSLFMHFVKGLISGYIVDK